MSVARSTASRGVIRCLSLDPQAKGLQMGTRLGSFWCDPKGRLWLLFRQSVGMFNGSCSNWFVHCDDPDAEKLVWTEPVYIGFGRVSQQTHRAEKRGVDSAGVAVGTLAQRQVLCRLLPRTYAILTEQSAEGMIADSGGNVVTSGAKGI